MPCTQLHTHKSGGWHDTNGMLEWCKARRECLLHFWVQMLQGGHGKIKKFTSRTHSVPT
jgi:hypothetical protein